MKFIFEFFYSFGPNRTRKIKTEMILTAFNKIRPIYSFKQIKQTQYMTTNKRNQDKTGQLSTHNIFIKQLSQWRSLSENKLVWRAKKTLNSLKSNYSRRYVIISILLVLNNFIKNLFIAKSRDDSCDLFRARVQLTTV